MSENTGRSMTTEEKIQAYLEKSQQVGVITEKQLLLRAEEDRLLSDLALEWVTRQAWEAALTRQCGVYLSRLVGNNRTCEDKVETLLLDRCFPHGRVSILNSDEDRCGSLVCDDGKWSLRDLDTSGLIEMLSLVRTWDLSVDWTGISQLYNDACVEAKRAEEKRDKLKELIFQIDATESPPPTPSS